MQQQKPEPLTHHAKYQKVKDLNSGTFGFVQLALDRTTGRNVAIKFIERGDKVTKYVEREIINHRQLVHPHIVQFKEVFLTTQHLAIAMEYAAGGDMFEYVVRKGGLRESEARWFFQQLIVAVDYIHRMGVANRDIKLENTLLDGSPRPLIKICDFGYSKHEKYQSASGSRVGTPAYLAPEVIMTTKGKTYDGKVADIWSCGVMLYVMLVGAYPFERPEDKHDNQKLQKMIQRILRVEYDWPAHIKLSPECRDLMSRILVADPAKRISIHEIQDHPWYMKDLPPGVKEMNDNMRMPPAGSQTEAEIRSVVQEAQKSSAMNPAGWEDDYIDDTMDAENYESSFDEAAPAPAGCTSPETDDTLLDGHPRYKQIRYLNRGAYGFVILAHDNATEEEVALKFIKRGPQHITKYVDREIANHMRLRHPHIIALHEVFLTKTHLVLAMEYAAGGDLFRYVSTRRGLPEDEARWFFQQLMVAVDYCHRMGVTSRDIKLENTLLDGGQWPLIKLADFGFSKDPKQQSEAKTRVGTPAYLAPEVIAAQPGRSYNAERVDIWSCGVLLYVMVVGRYPFGLPSDAALDPMRRLSRMMERTMRAEFSFPEDKPLSDGVKDLIRRILVQDPNKRLTLHDIQEHPWFMQGLEPGALSFNDAIVQESLLSQPTPDMLAEVHSIVQEALNDLGAEGAPQAGAEAAQQQQQRGGEGYDVPGHDTMLISEELSAWTGDS